MAFNTALSGIRAASGDLGVIGNNIANASTVGFKQSRSEFSDVYSKSFFGSGQNQVGNGVLLQNVAQQFSQGTVAFTDNALDLAINGNGFFVTSDDGARGFTRAGQFKTDQGGYLVNNNGHRLQGFSVSSTGNISPTIGDLQISSDNIAPRLTSNVSAKINMDAGSSVLAVRGTTSQTLGTAVSDAQTGPFNGYPSEAISIVTPNGTTNINTVSNASAASTASQLSAVNGVSATASTSATIAGFSNVGGSLVSLNGVPLSATNPTALALEINGLSGSLLPGVTASETGGVVTVASANGVDLSFNINNSGNAGDTMTIQGNVSAASVGTPVTINGAGGGNSTVGGVVNMTMDNNVNLGAGAGGLFQAVVTQTPFINNAFDPANQDSFNFATSATIFDSLGNSHVMTQYYVKEPSINTWTAYVQVDGRDVGDPNLALPAPANTEPTGASYSLVFNSDGSLDQAASTPLLISNWTPMDADGNPNGALNGQSVPNGGVIPVPTPATSSNFHVNLTGATQVGSGFAVNDITQDGYTTGRIAGIDIAASGEIFARYTNGESQVLGQIALASFRNSQGLSSASDTQWVETFDSGNAVIGTAGTAALGVVQAGALEGSNVQLSEQLVNLIIAQRNFQANSKTIQTSDTVTQAIINLR